MILQNYYAILYFIVVCLGFGISLDFFFKFTQKFDEYLYKFFALLTTGFGFFMLSMFLLGMIRMPMNYITFLIISLIIPILKGFRWDRKINFSFLSKFNKINVYQILTLVIVLAFFCMMLKGTFSYPWHEDDDPWSYSEGSKYVSEMRTYHTDSTLHGYSQYLFPHSHCMITVIFGLLNQVTPDLMFVMKFFICVFLMLGIMGFFLFTYNFTKNHLFAIIATAILCITPCFAGHFIYNYTLSVCLFLIFLFTLSLALKEDRYILLSSMILGSVLIAHPIAGVQTAIVMFIMILFYFVKDIIINRYLINKTDRIFTILMIGIIGMIFAMQLYSVQPGTIFAVGHTPIVYTKTDTLGGNRFEFVLVPLLPQCVPLFYSVSIGTTFGYPSSTQLRSNFEYS